MSDAVKDFRYYADLSEHQLQLSLGHEADGTRLLLDDEMKTRHVMRAHVLAVLAAAAPQPPVQHDPDCCCLPENKAERKLCQ